MTRGMSKDGRFYVEECYTCKVEFGIPVSFREVALQAKERFTFYCPYGHSQCYVTGESEKDKLRRERDQLVQKIAEKDDEIKSAWSTANAQLERAKKAETRVRTLKKRTNGGVCPCCNRHFTALERHMHTKHPDFAKEPA